MRMRRQQPEAQIQRAVIAHLRQRGAAGVFAFHVPNGGYRKPVEAAIFKSLGVVSGTPDIFVVASGRTYALELKADGGRLTESQRACHETLRAAGADVGVAVGIDEALSWLEARNLLRGRASV